MKRDPEKPECHYCKKQGKDIKPRAYGKLQSRLACNNCFIKHYDFFH